MPLTARHALEVAADTLGGEPSAIVGGMRLLETAGQLMEGAYEWRYLRRTTQAIAYRPQFTGTGATFTTATKVLSLTGGFAAYIFVPGDTVNVTIGGASFGTYKVTSRVDDNSVTIDYDLTPPGAYTIDFTMETGRVALPSDFGRLIRLEGKDSFLTRTYPSNPSDIQRLQTSAIAGNGFTVAYAVEWNSATPTSQPVATLRLWPTPDVTDFEALGATYSREWPTLTSDDDYIPIPSYMEPLYLQFVRSVASGYDAGGDAVAGATLLPDLVDRLRASRMFSDAAGRDAATQPDAGKIMDGAIRRRSPSHSFDPLDVGSDARLFVVD